MSTSEKLTYLNTTKQKLKQAINNLGGDITSETTFRNYVEELEGIYDNLPKTDYAEGSNITLSNTLKGKLDYENNIVGYGDASQDSATGSNLMNTEKIVNGTYNGLTITKDSDDFINISGTATANTSIVLSEITYNFPSTLYISYENTFTTNTAQLSFLNGSTTLGGLTFSGANRTYDMSTILGGKTCTKIELYITSGNTINGKFRPMLNTQSGQTYSKYAFPNPSYPSPVNVVRGKNIFDSDSIEQGAINAMIGSTYEQCKTNNATRIRSTSLIPITKNTDYTISFNSAFNVVVQPFDNSGKLVDIPNTNYGQWKASVFTINTGTIGYIAIAVRKANEGNIIPSEIDNVTLQIEKGSQATSYLPYNTIEVKARGINLLDKTQVVGNNTATTVTQINTGFRVSAETLGYAGVTTIDVKANTNYFLKFNTNVIVDSGTQKYVRIFAGTTQTTTIATYTFTEGGGTFNTGNNTKINIWFYCSLGGSGTVDYTNVQLQEGSTATTYEPYQTPQTYQLSLGEYELYTDSTITIEDNKYYINNKFSRYEFTGNETWFKHTTTSNNLYYIPPTANPIISNMKRPSTNSLDMLCYSNIAPHKAVNTMAGNNIIGINPSVAGDIYIGTSLSGISDRDTFKAYLQNNKSSFIYELITPTKEEITGTLAEQLEALYNAQSNSGTTVVTSDGDLPMILKLRALKGE